MNSEKTNEDSFNLFFTKASLFHGVFPKKTALISRKLQ